MNHVSKTNKLHLNFQVWLHLAVATCYVFVFFPNDFRGHEKHSTDFSQGSWRNPKTCRTLVDIISATTGDISHSLEDNTLFVFPDYILTNCTPKTDPILFFFNNCGGSTPPNNKQHLIAVLYRNLSDVFCLLNTCRVTVVSCRKNTSQHGSSWRPVFFH